MKYKRIKIPLATLIFWFTENKEYHFKCVQGLPENSKYVRAGHNQDGDMFIIVEHESFPELKHGDIIPEIEILFN